MINIRKLESELRESAKKEMVAYKDGELNINVQFSPEEEPYG